MNTSNTEKSKQLRYENLPFTKKVVWTRTKSSDGDRSQIIVV